MQQDLATTVAFENVANEFAPLVQAAGLSVGIIPICTRDALTPADLRRSLVRQLQRTLPASVPRSVRADASAAPNAEFARHEQRVRDAVLEQAHLSPTLRPVVTKDHAGREQTEFFGAKTWMNEYKRQPQLMTKIDGQPVRIPVVL